MCFSILRIIYKPQSSIIFRGYTTEKLAKNVDVNKIRNIGILAHIDAGKTTTTERMLYYSGFIKQMGEVHKGNTVTDYMAQERERGITIQSAAVTFMWKDHRINLIDTPGHIDFTMEVEQTLNVLDGVVVILDASAGVEAQTQTVWHQANRYKLPKIVFVNKMDRLDANFEMCCHSIEKKLDVKPLMLQIPSLHENRISGLVDILTLEKYDWSSKVLKKSILNKKTDCQLWEDTQKARCEIIDTLTEYDDALAEKVINSASYASIPTSVILCSLKRTMLAQTVVPVFCGSAYKNIGIEPLLDAVLLYLPNPNARNNTYSCFGATLSARAFKITHDKQKGAITFFRIYTGEMVKGQKIFNIPKNFAEQTSKLYLTFADEFRETETIAQGNIAAVTGLKHTQSGDLISNSPATVASAKKNLLQRTPSSQKTNEEYVEALFGKGPRIPEAVFFCSIEPPSISKQASLEQALSQLQREDPSLRVTHDTETGQIILGGMGELHLEIVRDRILKEYKIETQLGKLQIAYREAPIEKVSCDLTTEMKLSNTKQVASISLSVIPVAGNESNKEKSLLVLDRKSEFSNNISNIFPKHLAAVRHGIEIGLMHGPKLGSQVIHVSVMLHMLNVMKGTTEFVIEATATQCVQKLLKESGTCILEPIMGLEIIVCHDHVSCIIADICRRRGSVHSVAIRGPNKVRFLKCL
ncbi:translation elongation factor g-related [Holotrichia oblita]|uniref:Translation elongation factor g-related n=1 Tax=Holotrichia oblita TaxID=644536 RepID=A0ACB9TPP6_HOLOL|nr:translation elongation factor g-related [Holotrichia oblita]